MFKKLSYLALLAAASFGSYQYGVASSSPGECFVRADNDVCLMDPDSLKKSVVNYGNNDRILAALLKAKRGEEVTIGMIGGSVTQGAWTSIPNFTYANRLHGWWSATFPNAKINLVNAGIGSTDSKFGVERVDNDLLKYNPDFVVVEYDVNDKLEPESTKNYGELVKKIVNSPTTPGVILLATMDNKLSNAQEWHEPVAREFNLPYVSLKNAIADRVKAGSLSTDLYMRDEVHPYDKGHQMLAFLIAARLQSLFNDNNLGS